MKRIKYIFYIGCLMVMMGMSGCNDDEFLEEEPTTFYTVDNVFSTSGQVDQILVSIYSHIRDLWTNSSESKWIFNLKGKGTDMFDVPVIRISNSFSDYASINADHDTFYQVYSTWYYVVARANLAIYAANLSDITWSSDEAKAYALAQARFFRAFAYKNLAELFGGVPIVTEITTTARYDYTRESRDSTYKYAISEIEAIAEDLPVTTVSGGRLVRGVAYHYLSELYLALGTNIDVEEGGDGTSYYNNAVSYADKVIDGGTYSLMTSRFGSRMDESTFSMDIYKEGDEANEVVDTLQSNANVYWDLFQENNVNYQDGNKECLWAAQINYDAYVAEDNKSKLNYSRAYGPVFRDVASKYTTGALENVGGRGICQCTPTFYARDNIYADEYSDDMRNSEAVFRRRFKGNVSANTEYYTKDVSLDVLYNQSSDESVNLNNASEIYPVSCKIATDKYTGLEDGENRSNLFRDDYIVRLPETILLRAEAKQRLGNKDGAAADVNILRSRADCSYLVTAADMDDSFNTILDERARELVYEEMRWNTLLRMGGTIAVDRIRKYSYWSTTAATLTFDYNLWPIPQTIIDTNKDEILEQNEGWKDR